MAMVEATVLVSCSSFSTSFSTVRQTDFSSAIRSGLGLPVHFILILSVSIVCK